MDADPHHDGGDSDHDSLFGDPGTDGNLASLCGEHDKASSPLMEDGGESMFLIKTGQGVSEQLLAGVESTELGSSNAATAGPVACSTGGLAQLMMPTQPQDGSQSNETRDGPRRKELPSLFLPTLPAPADASFCPSVGHTAGENAVSTEHCDQSTAAASLDLLAEEDDLEAAMEYEWLKDQAINAHAGYRAGTIAEEEGPGIPLEQAFPGFRHLKARTHRGIRVPRRIDFDEQQVLTIVPYLQLKRGGTFKDVYEQLELTNEDGQALTSLLRTWLRDTTFASLCDRTDRRDINAERSKKQFAKAAFHFLKTEGWGTRYFGHAASTAQTRKTCWPKDSTMIMIAFIKLLYRVVTIAKADRSRADKRLTTPTASRSQTVSPAPSDVSSAGAVASAAVPAALPANALTAVSTADPAAVPAAVSPGPLTITENGTSGDQPTLFESLARSATLGQLKMANNNGSNADQPLAVEVPGDAQLRYRIFVKDPNTALDLCPPVSYDHSDDFISEGAFTSITLSFAAHGKAVAVFVLTPGQAKQVNSEDEWEQAVLKIYNRRLSSGDVEVEVFILGDQ